VVNAELVPDDDIDSLGDLVPSWLPQNMPATGAPVGAVTGPCVILRAEGDLMTLGGADAGPYFLQFFDLAVAPTSGVSRPFYCIGPLTVQSDFSADHTVRPDLYFANGLQIAFSTTDTVYTAVSSGGLDAQVSVGIGQ
jgi:hypothetical protein